MSVKRALSAIALLSTAACAGVLSLRDIDEGALAEDAGETPDATATPGEDATSTPDAHVPSNCDRYPNAVLCDGFEADAASGAWRIEKQGGVLNASKRPPPTDAGPYPNAVDYTVGFSPLPAVGKAALAFDSVPTGQQRALRFWIWIPDDAYPDHLPVAGLVDKTGGVQVTLDDVPDAAPGRLVAVRDTRIGDASAHVLGLAPFKTWTCVEVALDGASLSAWLGSNKVTGTISTTTADSTPTAEVGLSWSFGGGISSVSMHYDDVVVGTTPVGCEP